MLPAKMMMPTMKGKVPASTPALDQPMPLSRLEMNTAAPKLPVRMEIMAGVHSRAFPKLESYRHAPGPHPSRNGFAVVAWSIAQAMRLEGWPRMAACLLYTSDAADDLLCVDLG